MMKVHHVSVAPDVSLQRFGATSKAIHLRLLLTLYGYSFPTLSNEVVNNVILKLRCLRILSSSGCVFLSDSIGELKHLRFLDLSCTSIKRLPNSKCRDTFIVGEDNGTKREELRELSNLRGELSLMNLKNVASATDTSEARYCNSLPLLGQLSSLKTLLVEGLSEVVTVGAEFYRNIAGSSVTKPFESLEFSESLGVSLDGDGMLTSLSYISVYGCPNFVSFAKGGLHAPNLTRLRVEGSKKLKKLPEQMRNLLPFLNTLQISNCPESESFPEGGLPSHLNRLWIMNCPKLIAQRMKWNFHAFQVLTNFSIGDECGGGGVELFPEEGLLPSTLSSIRIHKFPHLKMLDIKGLQQFTSLECLCISECPQLEKLSQQRLSTSLKHFQIDGCPLLEERCRREKGEDWNIISHIPRIWIDYCPI
ncbi:putative disease resistance protein At3g14460 [Ziziphus jujuba]|uniref:Disease resistance protein At3g14460 n=1 Tax=Ziziphus jujuba TaxID=326968 RepID=A0ABM3I1H1_ZIZJJ|nr:putative disease resistance protein At3g14460 [Ziziphus jujuba]